MKKLLFALSAAAVAFASDALCGELYVTANTSPDNAASVDGNTGVVLKTNRPDADMPSWADYYLKSTDGTLGTFVYSSDGKGYHGNYHILLENDASFSALENFQYNGWQNKLSSAGYSLESANGSAITVKATNEAGFKLNLESHDADFRNGNTPLGKTGRTFTIGKNVTFETSAVEVSGKLHPLDDTYTDSMFYVDGTLNLTGKKIISLKLDNTNMTVRDGGLVQNEGKLNITNGASLTIDKGATFKNAADGSDATSLMTGDGSTLTINGTFENTSGVQIYAGAKVVVGETGVMNGMAAVYGGSLELNGTLNNNIATTGGSISFGKNVDFSNRAIELRSSRNGDINFVSDGLVGTMRTQKDSGVSKLVVADGKTLTAKYITVNEGTELNIKGGRVAYSDSGSTYDGYANTVANEWVAGTLTIGADAVLDITNNRATSWSYSKLTSLANISIAGGTLNLTGLANSLTGVVKMGTLSITDGGTLAMKTGTTSLLIANGGSVSVDATSKIASNHILFGPAVNGSYVGYDSQKELYLGGGSSYTGRIAVMRTSKNVLTLANGEYNFSVIAFKGYAGSHDGEAVDLTINLGDATLLHIGKLAPDDGTTPTLATLIFNDFANDIVKIDELVKDSACDISDGVIKSGATTINLIACDKSGELLSGGVWQLQNGYLNYVIPEPAEWAAIFGAIALAFAAYRRRK